MTMTTDEITATLRAVSLTHLLAVDAARATLRNLPTGDPRRLVLKLELSNAYGRMGLARGSYGNLVTEPREYDPATVLAITEAGSTKLAEYESTLAEVATEMAEPVRTCRSGFTVEETDAILAKHYPWALSPK